jgi:predicted dehydrogenase
VVCVPANLVAKIPDGVSYDEASFTVIGAIGLQGIRLVNPSFGETVVVMGLGLIGLLTAQLLKANGCRVIGTDVDPSKIMLAQTFGVEALRVEAGVDAVAVVMSLTGQVGADAVIITASTTSNELVTQAAQMSRKRGRIVLVGVTGLQLQRADFYEKELSFQVSCSYGPGRYDENYELKGNDYPLAFVRWTEQRNFEAILAAMANGSLQVKPLISGLINLSEFDKVYGNMAGAGIASILVYSGAVDAHQTTVRIAGSNAKMVGSAQLGIVGAGNFAGGTILPMLKKAQAQIKYLASANGLSGTTLAKKFAIPFSTTSYADILADPEVGAVVIATRHHLHARQTIEALRAGKHVFVEKPLALNITDLNAVEAAMEESGKTVMVGFNRRFSPFAVAAKKYCSGAGALTMTATMNAGAIPASHWVHDMQVGGGRIVGEACHLIDLMAYLCGSTVTHVVMNALGPNTTENTDNASILLRFANGSQGIINYVSTGSKAYAKERVEIFWQQKTIIIDNFRKLSAFGLPSSGFSKAQDKGHEAQFSAWVKAVQQQSEAPIAFASILNTSKAVLAAVESLTLGTWIRVD